VSELVLFEIAAFTAVAVFGAFTLLVECQEENPTCKKLNDEVLPWLSVWSAVHMVQMMPLPPHLLRH